MSATFKKKCKLNFECLWCWNAEVVKTSESHYFVIKDKSLRCELKICENKITRPERINKHVRTFFWLILFNSLVFHKKGNFHITLMSSSRSLRRQLNSYAANWLFIALLQAQTFWNQSAMLPKSADNLIVTTCMEIYWKWWMCGENHAAWIYPRELNNFNHFVINFRWTRWYNKSRPCFELKITRFMSCDAREVMLRYVCCFDVNKQVHFYRQ